MFVHGRSYKQLYTAISHNYDEQQLIRMELQLAPFYAKVPHPAPMTEKHRKVNKIYRDSAKEVADKIMKEPALELRSNNNSNDELFIADTGVSVDGTWQKRGLTSLNGVVAAISKDTGRILDVEVMTRYCQGCINIMKYKDDLEL